MRPNSEGLYHLDPAHVHLLLNFVAQGWHAPRPEVAISQWERPGGRAQTLNVIEILNLANGERAALKVEKGRLLARSAPLAWQRPGEDVLGIEQARPRRELP